jgi:hypothetical protein
VGLLTLDHMVSDKPYRRRLADAGLATVKQVLVCQGDRVAAWSRTSDTVEVQGDSADTSLYVKRFHYPTWRHRLRWMFAGAFFGPSRARQEYAALGRLRRAGIQAVRPVAYGERRVLHFVRSCLLITEAVPDAISLATFIRRHAPAAGSWDVRRRREIIASLAEHVRRMHDAGFVHGRLFWRNVLVRPVASGPWEFYVLDTAPMRRHLFRRGLHRKTAAMQDIASLMAAAPGILTGTEMLRFARCYLQVHRLQGADRQWALQVGHMAASMTKHEKYRLHLHAWFDQPTRGPRPAVSQG